MRFMPLLSAALLLVSCGGPSEEEKPQALPVQTITVTEQAVPNIIELPGRVEALRSAEVRARVTGILERQIYRDGSDVREGQPLFRIDPSELRADYAQTEASLQRARATAANANAVVQRYKPLVNENAISRQEYDAAVAAAREAAANVAQMEAQLRSASLQLGYTTVRAPISGRAGRRQVTEGALVSQAEGTLLTTIEQISSVYVTFSQSASEVLNQQNAIAAGEVKLPDGPIPVTLTLPNGTKYGIPGTVDFLDQSVDLSTGTVQLRAKFANPQALLLPGEFVRVRVELGYINGGIAVPQSAVTMSETGGSVYVVDQEGKVSARKITLGEMFDKMWAVESGLKPGDRVIVNNLQKLRPGMPVQVMNPNKGASPASKQPGTEASAKKSAAPGN
jgi:membrane fusion protein, multidrug efflux system